MAQPVGVAGAPAKLPPPPKASPPPASTTTGNNPRGVAIAPPPKPTVNDRQAVAQTVATAERGTPRGTSIPARPLPQTVNDRAATNPNPAATIKVFQAQPKNLQQQILARAQQAPDNPASKILLHYAALSGGHGIPLASVTAPHVSLGAFEGDAKGPLGFVAKLLVNAGKDAVTLPAETLSTGAVVGGDVAKGQLGKAAGAIVNPYVQLVEHPVKSFVQHPLLTPLMAAGPIDAAARGLAGPVASLAPDSALGRVVSTNREGVALTGKLTHERPAYSKFPPVKAAQVLADQKAYTRAETGELVPKSEQVRARQLNQGVGELVGTQERIRRANRAETQAAREEALRPSLGKRTAHTAKTALAYNPKRVAIPGADVLARIADGTIRRPDTVAQDIGSHLQQVAATRPDLLDDPKALKAHDAYVKQLTKAANDKAFLKNPAPAFKAAEAYAKDYPSVEAQARNFGHFGSMSDEQLQARTLAHYAVTHMGAEMDPEKGLIDDQGKPLSNAQVLAHIKGPNGTGGRLPVFTSDRPRFDAEKQARQANFVSSARRPLPNTNKNTLYAYTHGLTEPGHSALTEQHVMMQGIVDSHKAQNNYLETLTTSKPGGGHWSSYQAAKADAPSGYTPINISQPFHPQKSLDMATEGLAPATIEEEAARRSLDLRERTQPGTTGRWALIDDKALRALNNHQNQISPNPVLRTIRGLNNQFRTVALATSPKHVPGVAAENVIRDVANGVGFRSWVTGRRMLSKAEELNPEEGKNLRTSLTGGQLVGMTEQGKTYTVASHWQGTNVYPFLKAMEATFKAPGPRQLRTAWNTWTHFALGTTKHLLEQQHQIAGLGKAALREHGYAEAAKTAGFMGLAKRAFGLHGQMLDDAAKGLFDPAKARQMRATINQLYGKWTDLSSSSQTMLMFSPFGLWWANSAKFLARMPVDMPVKTSVLAAATVGTQKQRQAEGLDMFSPGALPLYMQGGIPMGGKVLAQNYYSPFGIANDPLETAQSLIQPWATPAVLGSLGVDWLGKPLTAPGQNTNKGNEKSPNTAQRLQYILDSGLASFVPLYTKAEQVAEGGGSPYDVSGNSVLPPIVKGQAPATKTPGRGIGAGLGEALRPVREYGTGGSSGNYLLGGTSSAGSGYLLGGSSSAGSGYLLP